MGYRRACPELSCLLQVGLPSPVLSHLQVQHRQTWVLGRNSLLVHRSIHVIGRSGDRERGEGEERTTSAGRVLPIQAAASAKTVGTAVLGNTAFRGLVTSSVVAKTAALYHEATGQHRIKPFATLILCYLPTKIGHRPETVRSLPKTASRLEDARGEKLLSEPCAGRFQGGQEQGTKKKPGKLRG
jgi:hypothetical protein